MSKPVALPSDPWCTSPALSLRTYADLPTQPSDRISSFCDELCRQNDVLKQGGDLRNPSTAAWSQAMIESRTKEGKSDYPGLEEWTVGEVMDAASFASGNSVYGKSKRTSEELSKARSEIAQTLEPPLKELKRQGVSEAVIAAISKRYEVEIDAEFLTLPNTIDDLDGIVSRTKAQYGLALGALTAYRTDCADDVVSSAADLSASLKASNHDHTSQQAIPKLCRDIRRYQTVNSVLHDIQYPDPGLRSLALWMDIEAMGVSGSEKLHKMWNALRSHKADFEQSIDLERPRKSMRKMNLLVNGKESQWTVEDMLDSAVYVSGSESQSRPTHTEDELTMLRDWYAMCLNPHFIELRSRDVLPITIAGIRERCLRDIPANFVTPAHAFEDLKEVLTWCENSWDLAELSSQLDICTATLMNSVELCLGDSRRSESSGSTEAISQDFRRAVRKYQTVDSILRDLNVQNICHERRLRRGA